MKVNYGMLIAIGIHTFVTISLFADPDYSSLGYLGIAVLVANILGIILVKSGKYNAGYKTFMISSAVFVPIGLIGAMSARKELDKYKKEEFDRSIN